MIAEELMVGDFINYRKKPIRVEEILKTGIIGGFVEKPMREGLPNPYSVWKHPQFEFDFVIVKDAGGYYSAYNTAEDTWKGSEICAVPDAHSFQHLLRMKGWSRRKDPFLRLIV